MNKDEHIKIVNKKFRFHKKIKKIILDQIEKFYDAKNSNYTIEPKYKINDTVVLEKNTLLHGTYKNLDGLKEIVKEGLISSWFIDARNSKYPGAIGVWNLKRDYLLKDYINFYSGGTVLYYNHNNNDKKSEIIPYDKLNTFIDKFKGNDYLVWKMEQTKEARFLPSLVQNQVQIGIIYDSNNDYIKELLKGDILNPDNINDEDSKYFVNKQQYNQFVKERKNKNDFFTDRESAIIFGIPSNFIEGILVGREYEKNEEILNEIKELLPNSYICNLDGKVIK